jgi:aminoglycoside N3'-acetyltransferase
MGMGAIADEFRRRPDTILGSGEHRVCVWGRDAALHSQGYAYLLSIDGWVLLIGVDIHHEAERRGMIRRRRIGRAECMLFRAKPVVGLYEHLLRTNPFGLFGLRKDQ